MASIGGVLMSGGLINGYSIAAVAAQAAYAESVALSAYSAANNAASAAENALNVANTKASNSHIHSYTLTYGFDPDTGDAYTTTDYTGGPYG